MKESLFFSFSLIGQIGFATAVPLVVFGLIGRYFDHRFGTSPYLFLLGLTIATVVVFFTLKKLVKEAIAKFNKLSKEETNTKKQ